MTFASFLAGCKAILDAIPALRDLVRMFRKSTEQKVQEKQSNINDQIEETKKTGRPPV